MVKSSEFRAETLKGAIQKATAACGGLAAAANAFNAVRDSTEARRLAREAEAEAEERRADSLGDEILRIADAYRRAGCDASRRIS